MARLGWPAPKRAGQPGYFSGRQLCRDSESEGIFVAAVARLPSTAWAMAAALTMPILTKGFRLHLASNRERDCLERRPYSSVTRPIDLAARFKFARELHTESKISDKRCIRGNSLRPMRCRVASRPFGR